MSSADGGKGRLVILVDEVAAFDSRISCCVIWYSFILSNTYVWSRIIRHLNSSGVGFDALRHHSIPPKMSTSNKATTTLYQNRKCFVLNSRQCCNLDIRWFRICDSISRGAFVVLLEKESVSGNPLLPPNVGKDVNWSIACFWNSTMEEEEEDEGCLLLQKNILIRKKN